jgi:acyl-CoA thioester hydrolase
MTEALHTLLAPYPVRIEIPVQWGDMDANHHVNNVVYLRWSENVRVEYLYRLAQGAGILMPVLGEITCKFIFPVTYPDTILAGVRVTDLADDRFTMETLLASTRHQRVAAIARGRVVNFDHQAGRKAPLPPAFAAQIAQFEADCFTAVSPHA